MWGARGSCERDAVGDALEQQQQHERRESTYAGAWATSPGRPSWPENRTSLNPLPVVCWKPIRQPRDEQPDNRQHEERARCRQALGASASAHDRGGDRSATARAIAMVQPKSARVRTRKVWERERTERVGARAEPGPRSHAKRDKRPDPGGEQPGDQHQSQLRPAQTGGLDQ